MISNDELPHHANRILDALSSGPMLWLRDIPNRGTRRRALYERFPGIRSTGVYLIRDVQGPPGLFYVGKVIQDPEDPDTVNPNADGIIGRLSAHQNMSGSNALARWYAYTNPGALVPAKVCAGPLRDRIRAEAATRMGVTFHQCSPAFATPIEMQVIRCGLPGQKALPLLNSPNWIRPRTR